MDPRIRTILLDGPDFPCYDQSDPSARAEAAFETTALRVFARLYPSCHTIPFKPLVTYNGSGWRPDVAIIDHHWRYWFVVEMEIATHSLEKHVLPQVCAFRDGEYGTDAAELVAHRIGLSLDRAETLIRYVPRYIVVVSNRDDSEWERKLSAENIQFISIAEFQQSTGSLAYLVSGLLSVAQRSVGFGTVLASHQAIRLPRNDFWKPGSYRVAEPGSTAQWDCLVEGQTVWLTKRKGIITIEDESVIQIIEQDGGLLLLRRL